MNTSQSLARPSTAESVGNYLGHGWEVEVREVDPRQTPRSRMRLLVIKGPQGYRMLPFMTSRVARTVRTEHGTVTVEEEVDFLPNNLMECCLNASLFWEESLQNLVEEMADIQGLQAALPRDTTTKRQVQVVQERPRLTDHLNALLGKVPPAPRKALSADAPRKVLPAEPSPTPLPVVIAQVEPPTCASPEPTQPQHDSDDITFMLLLG